MKQFFTSVMLVGAYFLQGQDYQAIDAKRAYVFSYNRVGANYDVAGFKVDSTQLLASKELHYFNKNYERNSYLCYSLAPVWIGSKHASIDATSEDVFYNKNEEAITLKRNAKLNQEWLCYTSGSVYVTAKVTQIDYQNHLEGHDSVKTVSFRASTVAGTPLEYQLNTLSIKVSKKKGLVQAINFKDFPGGLASETPQLKTYTILGATRPSAGIPPMSKASIYDYLPGDEIHTQEVKYALPAVGSYYDTINIISTVLNKVESSDSITLFFKELRQSIKATNTQGGITYGVSYSTGLSSLQFSKNDFLLPGSSLVVNEKLSFYTQSYANGATKLVETSPGHGKISGSEFCIYHLFCETSDEINYYYNGLGGPYFSLPRCYISYWGWNKKLIYAKKSDVFVDGTPFDFGDIVTSLTETEQLNGLQTSPNPFSDELVLENTMAITDLRISDLQGHLHLSMTQIGTGRHSIQTAQLPPGMYLVAYTDHVGQKHHKKLLKN